VQGIGVSAFCPGLVQSRIFQQFRHRQDSERGLNGETDALRERRMQAMAAGMDPLECGRKVLRGVCRNDLYILTHPEFREGFNDRVQAVMHAFEVCEDDPIPQTRVAAERVVLRHPVYARAIDA
jgi:short-subunit dehydrogenase